MQSIERTAPLSASSSDAPLGGPGRATRDSTGADICALGEADICALGERSYRSGLATSELVAEIRGLLATERRVECLLCNYLGDLADRIQARQDAELGVYADELDAARHLFGLGARDTRERVRVGRALRMLPGIERAFIDGQLCYSRVREVTRVATVHSEPVWLELARRLDMRSLERRVAAERDGTGERSNRHDARRVGERAHTQWIGAGRVRVTFELSVEAWTVLERAMREARRAGTSGPSDGDALEAIARAALWAPRADPSDASDGALRYQWATWDESEKGGGEANPGRSMPEASGCGETTGGRTARELGTEATQGGSAERAPRPGAAHELATEATQGGSAERAPRPGAAHELATEATQGGSAERAPRPGAAHELATEAIQGGSAERATGARDRRINGERSGSGFVDQTCEPSMRLMRVMGHSGGWTLDALSESSGLSVREVCVALTLLEVGGRVRQRAFAFDPV